MSADEAPENKNIASSFSILEELRNVVVTHCTTNILVLISSESSALDFDFLLHFLEYRKKVNVFFKSEYF